MKERIKRKIKKRRPEGGLLAVAVLLAVIVTVVDGYGMDFGGFDVNVEGGGYEGEEFPVWEETPGQVPSEPMWPENPVEQPSEQLPQEPVWQEEPPQEVWPPESMWQEELPQEQVPPEQQPPEMMWQENFSWEQSPSETIWQGQIPPEQSSSGEAYPETSWKAQNPTPILTVTPIPSPTAAPKPTVAPIPTQIPNPTKEITPTPTHKQNAVSSPVFYLIERNDECFKIEVKSEGNVQILSLRVNGRECPWHLDRDTILVDAEMEDGKNKIEILAFFADCKV